ERGRLPADPRDRDGRSARAHHLDLEGLHHVRPSGLRSRRRPDRPGTAPHLAAPAPATPFARLDATTVLNRAISELGIYPAVDPLDSTSRLLDPQVVGPEHYAVARKVQSILQRYKELQDIIAILGMDELSEEDKLSVAR